MRDKASTELYLISTLEPIIHLIEDKKVTEIMVCPIQQDVGRVWVTLNDGTSLEATTKEGNPLDIRKDKLLQIIQFMAGFNDKFTHEKRPVLECRIPGYGFRFTAVLQPASIDSPIFNIRKFSSKLYTFDDYIEQGLLTNSSADILRNWIKEDYSIAIAGCTGSGKTTFVSSYIAEKRKADLESHWVVLEDTPELNISYGNVQRLLTTEQVSMDDLLKVSLRLTPDQTCVGEVRGKEAYTFMKLLQTGHKGLCTMHAYSVEDALFRFEHMIKEHKEVEKISRQQIAKALDGIISIQKEKIKIKDINGNWTRGLKRTIDGIAELRDYDEEHGIYDITNVFIS